MLNNKIDGIFSSQCGSELLSASEEKELISKAQNGDVCALNKLINCNLKFVIYMSKKFMNKGLSLNELVGEGVIGLWKGIKSFDVTTNYKLITYAAYAIKTAINSALRNHDNTFNLSEGSFRLLESAKRLYAMTNDMKNQNERLKYISEILNVDVEKIEELLQLKAVSMDTSLSDSGDDERDGESYFSSLAEESQISFEDTAMNSLLSDELNSLMDERLNFVEKNVLERCYGLNGFGVYTLSEIGKIFGKTKGWAFQKRNRALKKLSSDSQNLEYYLAS